MIGYQFDVSDFQPRIDFDGQGINIGQFQAISR